MSLPAGNTKRTPAPEPVALLDLLYFSPLLIICAVALCDLISNALATALLSYFDLLSHPLYRILDSLLLVLLLFPTLILLVFRPIQLHLAKRRSAEEELAAERNKLGEILAAIPDGTCIVNGQHLIEYGNAALQKEFGPSQGRTCHEYFWSLPGACSDCRIGEVYEGKDLRLESRSQASGKVYEVFHTPLHNADGSMSQLTMMRDITARKLAEDELRASRQQLRSLSDHQRRVREEERTAVSREIHDELGQVLATVQLGVSSLADEFPGQGRVSEKIADLEKLLHRAIKTVQKISTQLRPSVLDELGLAEAIEWQAAEFSSKTGIACTPDILLLESDYHREVATAVFRIFQESLTNVMRHSGATRVGVSLEERCGRLVLIVADNGCGITPQQLKDGASLGITGMRERAFALGGRVRFWRSSSSPGSLVIARIPAVPPGAKT